MWSVAPGYEVRHFMKISGERVQILYQPTNSMMGYASYQDIINIIARCHTLRLKCTIIIIINLFCQIYNQIADIIVQWQATRKTEVQLAGGL